MMTKRLYICFLLAVCLSFPALAQQPQKQPLKPFQEKAVAEMIRDFPERSREAMRPSLQQMVQSMNETQVQSMMKGFQEVRAKMAAEYPQKKPSAVTLTPAPPRQAAQTLPQLDPILRKLWTANQQFDRILADKERTLRFKLSGQRYASYGQGAAEKIAFRIINGEKTESYENTRKMVAGLMPAGNKTSFNVSKVNTSFDKAQVEKAIDDAYARFQAVATRLGADLQAQQKILAATRGADRQQVVATLMAGYQKQADQINDDLAAALSKLRPSIPREMEKVFQ